MGNDGKQYTFRNLGHSGKHRMLPNTKKILISWHVGHDYYLNNEPQYESPGTLHVSAVAGSHGPKEQSPSTSQQQQAVMDQRNSHPPPLSSSRQLQPWTKVATALDNDCHPYKLKREEGKHAR